MKKKGSATFLQRTIVALFVFFLLFAGGSYLFAQIRSVGDREICRLSVIAKTSTKGFLGEESNIFADLECRTQVIQVKEKGVFKNGKRLSSISLKTNEDITGAQNIITKAIADEMYDCWYQFRGQDPFGQYNANLRCVPCATITFEDEVSEKIPTLPSFYTHLASYTDNSGEGYMSYLSTGYVGDDFDYENNDVDLVTSHPYSVLFETSKDDNLITAVSLGFLGTGKSRTVRSLVNKGTESMLSRAKVLRGLSSKGTAVRVVGKTLWVASIGILLYDLSNEEEPNMYGIEIVNTPEVTVCDQFY